MALSAQKKFCIFQRIRGLSDVIRKHFNMSMSVSAGRIRFAKHLLIGVGHAKVSVGKKAVCFTQILTK